MTEQKKRVHILYLIRCFLFSLTLIVLLAALSLLFRFSSKEEVDRVTVTNPKRIPQIILDAGHGGEDPGAISCHGQKEKDLNLAVTMKIGSFLEGAGIRVIYTRTQDCLLTSEKSNSKKLADLIGRVDVAKANPDATFVSIHMNTLSIEKYSGLQVFYPKDSATGKALAQSIQSNVALHLQPDNHREAKPSGSAIYVLDRIGEDCVLIECGFLSNRAEASLLGEQEYQNKLAYTISCSLIEYLLEKEAP